MKTLKPFGTSYEMPALQRMYFKTEDTEMGERIMLAIREKMESSTQGRRKLAEGLVLELRDVREHERDGVSVVEHVKGFWVKPI
jgi:hypothetical protein